MVVFIGARQNEEELRTRNETINQLKRYLGESEQVSKSTEIWRKEMENLKNKLQVCIHLLHARFVIITCSTLFCWTNSPLQLLVIRYIKVLKYFEH